MTIVGIAHDMAAWAGDREWARNLWSALRPYSLGIGNYINVMVEFEEDRIRASYGTVKYERLSRIKGVYDPDNVFRCNVNIPPLPSAGDEVRGVAGVDRLIATPTACGRSGV